MTEKLIKVIDKHGKILAPCKEKVAWVLIQRKRAIRIDQNTIQITLTKKDIKQIKREAIERDNRICHYCGKVIPENEIATADHVSPKHIFDDGSTGYDDKDNLVCACFDCNNHKASISYEKYCNMRVYTVAAIIGFLTNVDSEYIIESLFETEQ